MKKAFFLIFLSKSLAKALKHLDNVFIILVSIVKYKQDARKFKEFLECPLSSAADQKTQLPKQKFSIFPIFISKTSWFFLTGLIEYYRYVILKEVQNMAKCDFCGKGVSFGIKVSHSHRRSNRTWKPNVMRVKAIVNGKPCRVHACTRCLRSNKVTRAV